MKVNVADRTVERVADLLREISNREGFDYPAHQDDGLRLRQEAVDRVLAGERLEKIERKENPATDLMGDILASLEKRKGEKVSA